MDYSVEGYLRRRTEDELEQILKEFIQKREDQYYEMWIEIIQKILKEKNGECDETEESNGNVVK